MSLYVLFMFSVICKYLHMKISRIFFSSFILFLPVVIAASWFHNPLKISFSELSESQTTSKGVWITSYWHFLKSSKMIHFLNKKIKPKIRNLDLNFTSLRSIRANSNISCPDIPGAFYVTSLMCQLSKFRKKPTINNCKIEKIRVS